MAYHIDGYDQALVIDGWERGIAPNPYDGISDARNVLINSVPGEVSVGFSTGSLSVHVAVGTVTSVSGNVLTFTGAAGLENVMAITFGTVSGYSGFTASGTNIYWVSGMSGSTFKLYSDWDTTNQVTVTGSGNAGFTVYNPDFSNYTGYQPNKFARAAGGNMYLIDSIGQVWSNKFTTATTGSWTYSGNAVHNQTGFVGDHSNGNGIVYYQSSDGINKYIFAFSDSSIDFIKDGSNQTWTYAWNPADASTGSGNYSLQALNAGKNTGVSHEALVGQDNVVYYCDGSNVGSFFEIGGQRFDPTVLTTYTPSKSALALPVLDTASCLAELGLNLLVGGTRNFIYPWDRTTKVTGKSINNGFQYPIWVSEYVIQKMITVNTLTYIFAGNRGRIHVTNGTNAQEWLKMPDHLSGKVEPYYVWGGVAPNKNQIYFSVAAFNNDASQNSGTATANTNYGGIWAVDIISKNLRLVNQLSYGSYAGMASALFAISPLYSSGVGVVGSPNGAGLYAGWCSGNVVNNVNTGISFSGGTSGIDTTTSNPFTNSASYVDTDLIPLGTSDKPRSFSRIEYLLTKPLVSGESISLYFRTDFSQTFTNNVTNQSGLIATDSTSGNFTNSFPLPFSNVKWVQFRAVLNSTLTSPSYVRLKQLRLTGFTGPSLANSQQISI